MESVPGLDDERQRVLRQLLERGPEYREVLVATHARLIRLFPNDRALRTEAEGLDRVLARNIETLEEYFARKQASADARGTR
jgi:hypothetical protein